MLLGSHSIPSHDAYQFKRNGIMEKRGRYGVNLLDLLG